MQLLRASDPGFAKAFAKLVNARRESDADVAIDVRDILREVKARGDAALVEYTTRFDDHNLTEDADWRVDPAEFERAFNELSDELREALELAATRIRAYHEAQRPADRDETDSAGVRLGARWHPVDAAGLYVPGGRAAYPSSLLMNSRASTWTCCRTSAQRCAPPCMTARSGGAS
ncbi:histidinol dehydrogenase [Leptolyngbya sp. 15MV]|nr:histidinol dehydrogenase [Leptolyngbya sp. 15MV]